MEKHYEHEEFDKLMDKYNFNSPIEVTLVVEDEDPLEPVFYRDLPVLNNTNIPNTCICPNISEFCKKSDSNIDTITNKMPTAKKSFNIKPVFPEGHQENSQDIQWQLLDAVADNLIHITKYYFYNFDNIHVEMENNERLKFEYITFKHNIFYLSYNTTIALLLPRENDLLFINYFIHRVIGIANRISWLHISYEILDILIRELLIWTKQEKKKLDIKLSSHYHERSMDWSSSALTINNKLNSRKVLNRPFDNGPTTNHRTHYVPETHLPVQERNISPSIRHITNYSAQDLTGLNISPRINYPIQDIFNQISVGPIKKNATPKITKKCHDNFSETFHSEPEINISPHLIKITSHSNQRVSKPLNIKEGISSLPYNGSRINHSTETMTSIYNNEPKTNNFNSWQAMNTNTSKILLSTGPPNQEITISVDTKILANINHQNIKQLNSNTIESHVNKAYGTNSIKRRKTNDSPYNPYSHSKSRPHHNDNNFSNKQNNCSATTFKSPVDGLCHEDSRKAEYELFNTDTFRSSVSRDSGFGSPIYGSFRNEQTIEITTSEEQETPIISHVTSLNPSAVHLNIGFCKVCGATTNNVCIGCYKEYYCSFSCQTKDVENHQHLCSELVLS